MLNLLMMNSVICLFHLFVKLKTMLYYIHLNSIALSFKENEQSVFIDSYSSDMLLQAQHNIWSFTKPKFLDYFKNIISEEYLDVEFSENVFDSKNVSDIPKSIFRILLPQYPVGDLGLYKGKFLVASQKGYDILTKGIIAKKQADNIHCDIEEYFNSENYLFWMPKPLRSKFFSKFHKKI